MKKIEQDIKNKQFEQFYLLHGEEDYLKARYKEMLVNGMGVDKNDNMNYTVYEGKRLNVKEMLDLGDTLPFFADNRVIVVENSGFFKKTPEGLEKRLENFPESTHVIFVESEKDGRNRFFTWFKKHGYVTEMKEQKEGDLRKWVAQKCRREGKNIYEDAAGYFFGIVGLDMMRINNELEKVFSYVGDRDVITIDDIHAICVSEADDTMYEMLDAIAERDRQKALKLYRNLLELKVDAQTILSKLTFNIKRLLEISEMINEGKSYNEIATVTKAPQWTLNKYKMQIRKNTGHSYVKMFERCADITEEIRTGMVNEVVGVELLIIEFTS